tara:strand:+ start:881 stop:1156 length:276 start_codon:yes stop_codon:yes gene_type:complete
VCGPANALTSFAEKTLGGLVLATSNHWRVVLIGVAIWGLHMGIRQGFLASVIAGILWDQLGASATFYVGAALCVVALFELARLPAMGLVKT